MVAALEGWMQYPWHIGYAALRCMACQDWCVTHACPICSRADRNKKAVKDPWSYIHGCMEHLHACASCLGSLLNADSPDTTGASLIPSTADLLSQLHPDKCARDVLPPSTILYMDLVVIDHRQWSTGSNALNSGEVSLLLMLTRTKATEHLRTAVERLPDWRPLYRAKGVKKPCAAPPPPFKCLDVRTKM